jgi:hypothetical protein
VKRLVLAIAGTLALAGVAEAVVPSLNYRCNPGGVGDCGGWYRVPVQLTWVYTTGEAEPSSGDCAAWATPSRTFTADTAGTKVTCQVRDPNNHDDVRGTSTTIRVDRTHPSITDPGLARPPDRGDWFNHPVAFQFAGKDATSGVESCTDGSYGGPDGAGVSISGSCRDVAGNVTAGTFTLNYDATPPPTPAVAALPGNHRVALRWSSAQNEAEIVRLDSASSPTVVFRGATESYTDTHLRNGHRYRYVVTLIDQAGNRSAAAATAVPTDSRLLVPADGAHLNSAPELVWKPVKRARYYNVQLLFRDQQKVLSRWPRATHLQLHERWRFQGRRRLASGRYCWYVWPGYGRRAKRDYGPPLGKSCFTVTR